MSLPRTTHLSDVQLWDGTWTWCYGFREGLPVWKYGTAPAGLVTKNQLREQRLRRSRGQDPVGLLVFRARGCGEQVGELFRIDQAQPSREKTPRWQAAIDRMNAAHRTCRACSSVFEHYLPTSTWKCWDCMEATGDFGTPPYAETTTDRPLSPSTERTATMYYGSAMPRLIERELELGTRAAMAEESEASGFGALGTRQTRDYFDAHPELPDDGAVTDPEFYSRSANVAPASRGDLSGALRPHTADNQAEPDPAPDNAAITQTDSPGTEAGPPLAAQDGRNDHAQAEPLRLLDPNAMLPAVETLRNARTGERAIDWYLHFRATGMEKDTAAERASYAAGNVAADDRERHTHAGEPADSWRPPAAASWDAREQQTALTSCEVAAEAIGRYRIARVAGIDEDTARSEAAAEAADAATPRVRMSEADRAGLAEPPPVSDPANGRDPSLPVANGPERVERDLAPHEGAQRASEETAEQDTEPAAEPPWSDRCGPDPAAAFPVEPDTATAPGRRQHASQPRSTAPAPERTQHQHRSAGADEQPTEARGAARQQSLAERPDTDVADETATVAEPDRARERHDRCRVSLDRADAALARADRALQREARAEDREQQQRQTVADRDQQHAAQHDAAPEHVEPQPAVGREVEL